MSAWKRCVVGALALLVVLAGPASAALLTEGQLKKLRDSSPLFSQRSEYGGCDVAGRISKLDENGKLWGPIGLGDDETLTLGTSSDAVLQWETADANANALVLTLPEGGAINVPVFVIADITAVGADLAFFNGVVQPSLAIVDSDKDSWIRISYSADDTPFIDVGGASTTLGLADDVVIAAGKDLVFAAGAGYLEINGTTSGGIKIAPIATGTALATIVNQNVAASTITLPAATCTLPGLGLANVWSSTNEFAGVTQTGAATFATGTGAVSLNGDVTVAAGMDISLAAGAGYIEANGATSGGIRLDPIDVGTGMTTVVNSAGTPTITLPATTTTLLGKDITGQIGYLQLDGSTSGGIKIAPIATGTAVATIVNQNVAASTITLPLATAELATLGLAESLNTKTLTNAGAIAQTGAVAFTTGTGTVTLNGDVSVAANKDISLAAGSGYIEINAATTGSLKILPTASTAQAVTLGTAAQTSGAGTINIPDLAANTVNILTTDLYKTKWTFMIPGAVGEDTDGVLTNAGGVAGGSGATGVTQTEAAAAFAVVDDGGVMGTLAANTYGLFPAAPAAGDALYLGAAIPFCEFGIDMSATVATYDAAGVLAWEYSKGSSVWGSLTMRDSTGATGETGAYFGERDGAVSFVPPADWAADTVNGQSAYWIRAVIQAGKAANMTIVGLTASKEHLVVTPDGDAFTVPFKCNISKVRVTTTGVVHNQIVRFVLVNFTKGTYSLELSWAASQLTDTFTTTVLKAASAGVDCDAGDVLGICITEDNAATVNPTNIQVELDVTYKD